MLESSHIPLRLNLEEAVVLLVGVKLLAEMVESIEINGVAHERLIPELIDKLGQVVPEDLKNMTGEIVEDILVSDAQTLDGGQAQDDEEEYPAPMYPIETTLPVLVEAIDQHVSVDVTYYSMPTEEVCHYRLDPYGIKQVGELYWLVAYTHERDERSVFRIDRIKEVAKTDRAFERPANFKLDEFFADEPEDW